MTNKQLLDNLARLGFPLFETAENVDANKTLAEVVQSQDARLWEGFPVLLANAAKQADFSYEKAEQYLSHPDHRDQLKQLFLLSLALYESLGLKFAWAAAWRGKAAKEEVETVKAFQRQLAENQPVEVGGRQFFVQRLQDMFSNYYETEAARTRNLGEKQAALFLEYALSQLFSPKQKELFYKKLNGEPMTKTEREYYSRAVKKKVQALANPELHRMAQGLME